MTKREAEAFERQRGSKFRGVSFADVQVRSGLWLCRWCRSKAKTIGEIKHLSDCQLLHWIHTISSEVKT